MLLFKKAVRVCYTLKDTEIQESDNKIRKEDLWNILRKYRSG